MAARILRGALAGLIATVPMTAFMALAWRRLPRKEQYPLPPRQVTMGVAEAVGVAEEVPAPEDQAELTLAAHLAYGAAAGAAFGAIAGRSNLEPEVEGIAYGLVVWTASYVGWLPAVGLMPPVQEQPARRSALMIAAHVVWGAAVGTLVGRVLKR